MSNYTKQMFIALATFVILVAGCETPTPAPPPPPTTTERTTTTTEKLTTTTQKPTTTTEKPTTTTTIMAEWVFYNDPNEGYLIDIASVAFKDEDSLLFVGLITYDGWDNGFLQVDDHISFYFDVDQDPTTGDTEWLDLVGIAPDYNIFVEYDFTSDSLRATLWRWRSSEDLEKIGEYPVVHNNGETALLVAVPLSDINNPKTINWFGLISNMIDNDLEFDVIPEEGHLTYQVQSR